MASRHPLTRLWRRLRERHRPAPIATADALKVFLEERAALIAMAILRNGEKMPFTMHTPMISRSSV